MMTCKMLFSSSDPDRDIECGKPAVFYYKTDLKHVICQDCYGKFLLNDEDIAAEYERIEGDAQ